MTDNPREITPDMAGCWLDGQYGWHNTYRVIRIAQDYGFKISDDDDRIVTAYAEGNADADDNYGEIVIEISNDATDYLQSIAPAGYVFEWDTGELSLVELDDAE